MVLQQEDGRDRIYLLVEHQLYHDIFDHGHAGIDSGIGIRVDSPVTEHGFKSCPVRSESKRIPGYIRLHSVLLAHFKIVKSPLFDCIGIKSVYLVQTGQFYGMSNIGRVFLPLLKRNCGVRHAVKVFHVLRSIDMVSYTSQTGYHE